MSTVNLDVCGSDLLWVIQLLKIVIRIIQIAAPLALIIFGSLDFFKAIIAGDEKEMKAKRKPFIGRLVAAVVILFLPMLVNLIIKTVASGTNSTFKKCWEAAGNGWTIQIPSNSGDAWN